MLNSADAAFCEALARAVPGLDLIDAPPAYREEPRGRSHGRPGPLARPRSTAEAAAVVRVCAEARVGILPWGGGTGLVGGQVMTAGALPLIVSMERMAAVRGVWPEENVIVVEAGAILADVHAAAEAAGRIFPLTLASQGSARIGGLLSTNAGGVNVLRYGNARELCLGVEAVLPDGTVMGGLKRLRKDNTGYDLRGLLIGAEGTLGLIAAATLRLFAPPAAVGTAMIAVASPAAALDLLHRVEARLPGGVLAFELIAGQGLRFLDEVLPEVRQPFAVRPDWTVLVEIGVPGAVDPQAELAAVFEAAAADGLAEDGVIAGSQAQRADFWRLREALPEANRRIGAISSHDISLPLSELPGFIEEAGRALADLGDLRINCFGHVGDGNLHYNVFPARGRQRGDYEALRARIQETVHDRVARRGGSFSAEHGVGRLKVGDLERWGDPGRLAAMRAIKAALDPAGIMNPGAVLRG